MVRATQASGMRGGPGGGGGGMSSEVDPKIWKSAKRRQEARTGRADIPDADVGLIIENGIQISSSIQEQMVRVFKYRGQRITRRCAQ
jgi:hypothetical protein